MVAEDDLVEKYLSGEMIDPCEHDAYDLEKLDEFLGVEEEE